MNGHDSRAEIFSDVHIILIHFMAIIYADVVRIVGYRHINLFT